MKTKIEELKEVVGKTVSCNASPTLRAKLLRVNKKTCTMEVAPTEFPIFHDSMRLVGRTFKLPLEYVWNAFYY
jgi:hypothetical protein